MLIQIEPNKKHFYIYEEATSIDAWIYQIGGRYKPIIIYSGLLEREKVIIHG